MSKQTMMETLKGGILLMILLLILLLMAGGFMTWRLSKRDRGPAFKVTVAMPAGVQDVPASTSGRDESDVRGFDRPGWRDGGFDIPPGTVDVQAMRVATAAEPAGIPAEMAEYLAGAGLRKMVCRTFAPENERESSVDACSFLMATERDALAVLARFTTGPGNMERLRGQMTPDGFKVVSGNRYFDIRRSNAGDGARMAALAFLESIPRRANATADGLPGRDILDRDMPDRDILDRDLPPDGMVPGSAALMPPDGKWGAEVAASAEYVVGKHRMRLWILGANGDTAALESLEKAMLAGGGIAQRTTGLPASIRLIQKGNEMMMVGTVEGTSFMVRPVPNTMAAINLVGTLERFLRDRRANVR